MTAAFNIAHVLTADRSFDALAEYVIAATGLSYYRNRRNELAGHVARRLNTLGLTDCADYIRLLKDGEAGGRELDCLIEDLTIGETHFFRHPELFQALENTILPEAIERNKAHRRLRIWSAGSSIGAEAYTVSILLKHHLAHLTRGWDVSIIGTDINRSFLARAEQAEFEKWALRGTSDDIRHACFLPNGQTWTLKPQFREGVSFQYHNLAEHPFPSTSRDLHAFDVILCRNVMIYFSEPVIRKIVGNMRECLVDGGWLLVGHAEHNLDLFREYHPVGFHGASAYRRIDGPNANVPSRVPANNLPTPLQVSSFVSGTCSPRPIRQKASTALVNEKSATPVDLSRVRILADDGDLDGAVALCERLLKTHKMNPACHLQYAVLLDQLGLPALCETALRRALYVNHRYAPAHYQLGVILKRLGRLDEAARSLQNALHLMATRDVAHAVDECLGLSVAELTTLAGLQLKSIHAEVLPA